MSVALAACLLACNPTPPQTHINAHTHSNTKVGSLSSVHRSFVFRTSRCPVLIYHWKEGETLFMTPSLWISDCIDVTSRFPSILTPADDTLDTCKYVCLVCFRYISPFLQTVSSIVWFLESFLSCLLSDLKQKKVFLITWCWVVILPRMIVYKCVLIYFVTE